MFCSLFSSLSDLSYFITPLEIILKHVYKVISGHYMKCYLTYLTEPLIFYIFPFFTLRNKSEMSILLQKSFISISASFFGIIS